MKCTDSPVTISFISDLSQIPLTSLSVSAGMQPGLHDVYGIVWYHIYDACPEEPMTSIIIILYQHNKFGNVALKQAQGLTHIQCH